MLITAGILFSLVCTSVEKAMSEPLRSDDEVVLESALLAFFQKSDWNDEWDRGEFVVVSPNWGGDMRPDFASERLTAAKWLFESKVTRVEAEMLQQQVPPEKYTGPAFEPPSIGPLKDMKFDDRIIIGEIAEHFGFFSGTIHVKNGKGKDGTVRALATCMPPCFSPTGKYGSVRMSCSWSIHSESVRFFLQRRKNRWKVLHVVPIFHF